VSPTALNTAVEAVRGKGKPKGTAAAAAAPSSGRAMTWEQFQQQHPKQ
jgi:hypothetical protein